MNLLKKTLRPFFPNKDESETNEAILDMVEEVCVDKIEPHAADMDRVGAQLVGGKVVTPTPMPEIVELFRQNDLFGLTGPERYDGADLSWALNNAVLDRVSRADVSAGIYLALQATLVDYLNRYGSEEAKQHYLPDLIAGKRLGGFLYTEPGSGSDLGSIKTTAVKEGDRYVVNGEKIFISNAGVADTYSFLASTDPSKGSRGLTAFVLDARNQEGFQVTRLEEKLGIHASPTGQIVLDNVEIPVEDVLGKVGKGFGTILYGLVSSRIGIGAQAAGVADAAYRRAVAYVHERSQFGKPIIAFQGNQWKVADMATQLHLARTAYLHASRLKDMGQDFGTESSIAKVYGSEAAQSVTYEAIQLLGGYGYVREYDVERYYRDARVTTLYEGTSEVQRLIISRAETERLAGKK